MAAKARALREGGGGVGDGVLPNQLVQDVGHSVNQRNLLLAPLLPLLLL